jgi:phosphoglycolate phosphatase
MKKLRCGDRIFSATAIVFDKDGTLADSQQFLRQLGLQRAKQIPELEELLLRSLGCTAETIDPAGLLAVGTRQENEIAIATLIAQTGVSWMRARAIATQVCQTADQQLPRKADLTPPFAGMVELLRSLSGFKLAILSSDSSANVQDFVDRYQLQPFFSVQIGAQLELAKPDPRLLYLACQSLGVSPQQTIVIGDSQADLDLARQGGAIAAIGVTWGGVAVSELSQADQIVDRVEDIQVLTE